VAPVLLWDGFGGLNQPDDRAWCLGTDTDLRWAYIAGSAACIREVLSVPELDAHELNARDPRTWECT
jgi:hypothetical protein